MITTVAFAYLHTEALKTQECRTVKSRIGFKGRRSQKWKMLSLIPVLNSRSAFSINPYTGWPKKVGHYR